jgi:two-component system response regulator ResD
LAKIKASLRRVEMDRGAMAPELLATPGLTIDVARRHVEGNGKEVALQPREFDLLTHLMRNPGTVMTRDRLLNEVWGHEYVGVRTVDVHVRRVRAKLEQAGLPNLIRTVHGVGYSFDPAKRNGAL